ncbi:hypothetical protein [Haladaptatus litoreus]|uniref:hypothetical protein n=1 Tax=Haladaptatus litoreus TaxID=553468 RepID=UPI00158BAFAE|nr:hypothetical protein [Haladaptatus litoreus]
MPAPAVTRGFAARFSLARNPPGAAGERVRRTRPPSGRLACRHAPEAEFGRKRLVKFGLAGRASAPGPGGLVDFGASEE